MTRHSVAREAVFFQFVDPFRACEMGDGPIGEVLDKVTPRAIDCSEINIFSRRSTRGMVCGCVSLDTCYLFQSSDMGPG